MASPQLKNGFTEIANEIIEHLILPGTNGQELKLILFTIRKTYGFHKKQDKISLSQFQKALQVKRANICRIIKSLVAKRLLLKEKNLYKFNKNWEQWIVAKRLHSSQKDNLGSSQLATHKRKRTKENIEVDKSTSKTMKNTFDNEDAIQIDSEGEYVSIGESSKKKAPRNLTAFALMEIFKSKAAKNGYPKVMTDGKDYTNLVRVLKKFTKDQIEDMFDYYFAEDMPEKNNKGLGLSIAISKSTINQWLIK